MNQKQSVAAAAGNVRDYVASATLASLTRIAGGGFSMTSSAVEDDDAPSTSKNFVGNDWWRGELMKISFACVAFTNKEGLKNDNVENIHGKPHDMEVRAALMLFHRIRKEYCPNVKRKRMGEVEGKRKKKHKSSNRSTPARRVSESILPSYRERRDETDQEEDDITFDIISDLGTRRKIDSIVSLANLLALELERELTGNAQSSHDLTEELNETICDKIHTTASKRITFTDVRSDDSGIICLLTLHRSKQLYSHGRVPCPNCIKWFKGSKGLWWHQLTVHGNQYSSAIEVAMVGANSLAIVPYQVRDDISLANTQKLDSETSEGDIVCAFSLVKTGKFDDFKKLVEARKCTPKSQLDRNGASLLHWAAGCGRRDFVIYLIEQCNCCPNQGQDGKKSFLGRTPLHWAARNGHMSVVEYLVSSCKVDVDARTSDGTAALCWASWQGHLDIMKYLFESGADIHSTNKFACNALLWSAQGECSIEVMAWLVQSGLDFNLINTNGHSAFHKAAQRGNAVAVQWLANKFLSDITAVQAFIGPDNEGNCPSDLCGMEGHEILAAWISMKECDIIMQLIRHAASLDDLLDNHVAGIPAWLIQDLIGVMAHTPNLSTDMQIRWGPGRGVRRMSTNVMMHFVSQNVPKILRRSIVPVNDLYDID